MRLSSSRSSSVVWMLFLVTAALRAEAVRTPAAEQVGQLAGDLGARLLGRTIQASDGSRVTLFGAEDAIPPPILTPDRLSRCLATISEAQAWPSAWLVVQDTSRKDDLVLRIRLAEEGRIADPDPIFMAARREEWDAPAIDRAVREATGSKPAREKNVVVQSFTKRTETTYVYEPSREEHAQGLLALLPKGALIREAKRIELGDGKFHTVALVLLDAKFVPSTCSSCAARATGHVDTGKVLAILAGEKALEQTLDLTPVYREHGAEPFLPRYACAPGDEAAAPRAEGETGSRFGGRESVPLLMLERAPGGERSFRLPIRDDCEHRSSVTLAVSSDPPRIRVF
jgi:hypothetical protein